MRLSAPILALAVLWSCALGLSRPVAATPAVLCERAADRAAAEHGVPRDLMRAIALAETGTTRRGRYGPWPWTLNIAGEGRWFDSRAEARAVAEAAIAAGRRSTDIGCFQINWRWHGDGFRSIDAMLDPTTSADYAARFLKRLRGEAGDWVTAAGWYHSRTPAHAERYRGAVARALARIGAGDLPGPDARLAALAPEAASVPARTIPRSGNADPPAKGGVRLDGLRRAAGGLLRTP
ncbi:MAG: lytic transglycosylase domain-containing protein [Pikeienuella sp.]